MTLREKADGPSSEVWGAEELPADTADGVDFGEEGAAADTSLLEILRKHLEESSEGTGSVMRGKANGTWANEDDSCGLRQLADRPVRSEGSPGSAKRTEPHWRSALVLCSAEREADVAAWKDLPPRWISCCYSRCFY